MENKEQTKNEGKAMTEKQNLIILTDRNFQKEVLENRGPVLVEFGAEWCGPCHMIAPILRDLASEFKGEIKICQMDVDANKQVASQHGIQSIPTFLFFKNGQLVDHIFGAVPREVLSTNPREACS